MVKDTDSGQGMGGGGRVGSEAFALGAKFKGEPKNSVIKAKKNSYFLNSKLMPKIHNKYKKILNIARIYTSAMLKCIRA